MIEPVIQPLGFDWKIGVALIASFAAREVLVSTLSIIYNTGKDSDEESEGFDSSHSRREKRRRNAGLDTSDGCNADGLFRAGNAMYVNGRNRPARNKFLVVDAFYGRLYDRAGVFAAFLTYQGGRFLGYG